jgi:hypothetical protein
MSRRKVFAWQWLIAPAVLLITGVMLSGTASAGEDFHLRESAQGAVVPLDTCGAELPTVDTVCETFIISFGNFAVTEEGGSIRLGPLEAAIEHFSALIHPDGSAGDETIEVGAVPPATGSYDGARLSFAHLDGVTIPMNEVDPATGSRTPNGHTMTLGPLDWTAASDVYVFGNDGPFGFGLPRHVANRCENLMENAHERFTTARVTGTLNGRSLDSYERSYLPWPGTGPADAHGAVFDNHFTVLHVSKPGC